MTTTTAKSYRGTAEWQTAYLDAQHRVNMRAQVGLDLGVVVELDTSSRDSGDQLDMFADLL